MDSCEYIQRVIEHEVNKLHGQTNRLLFGGISQGGALAMWMLLCRDTEFHIGAFLAASTWLPFAKNIARVLGSQGNEEISIADLDAASVRYDDFICQTMNSAESRQHRSSKKSCTKVFLGHGLDDAYVDVELGRQASNVFTEAGFDVEWKEYSGAEEEGHWFQEPDEMDDIQQFMIKFMA